MINNYGPEFVSILSLLRARLGAGYDISDRPTDADIDVGLEFVAVKTLAESMWTGTVAAGGLIFYLPPGRYRLRRRDPDPRTRYVLPENVQLYMCQGALLRPDENVDLVIRGSLRAGLYQIFGYDRYGPLPADFTGLHTAPRGRILFATRLVPAVYPEWWGAYPTPPNFVTTLVNDQGQDSSDAIQAAIDAACGVHRDDPAQGVVDPVPPPSIPVLLGSKYQCNRGLTVGRPVGIASLHVILRGTAGLGTQNVGASTITRVRLDSESSEEAARGRALLLGPGVDFDIQDVNFGMTGGGNAVGGCVEIVCDGSETAPRRGLFRRCSFLGGKVYVQPDPGPPGAEPPYSFALRITANEGSAPRHFVLDACAIHPSNVGYLSDRGVEVLGGASMMLHIDGALMGAAPLPRTAAGFPALPDSATIYLTGGSVLVRATQFHNASGPRPSRGNDRDVDSVGLDRPDGQEVFLAAPAAPTTAPTHFTAVQCEAQGWWFLSRPLAGDEQVALINVAHNNVNWEDPENDARYDARRPPPRVAPGNAGLAPPPSVVWRKAGGQCLLVACRLHATVLTDSVAYANIVDVATVFKTNDARFNAIAQDGLLMRQHFRPDNLVASMARPPSYELSEIEDNAAFDFSIDHVVPIAGI